MATTEADAERTTRRVGARWTVAAAGVVIALLVVAFMNELVRNWFGFYRWEPNGEAYLIWSAVIAALAAFLGVRFPALALWVGGTLASLVAVGLLVGGPQDAFLTASSIVSDPLGLVRWAAHYLPIVVGAGSCLAAAAASRPRRRSR